MHSPSPDSIADLKAQVAAQRCKRVAAQQRLKAASADAAEGTPADSKFFRLFDKAKTEGNGQGTAEEVQAVMGCLDEAKEELVKSAKLRAARVEARQTRKKRLATLKKTSFEMVSYHETKRLKKKDL